ncbi:fibronectin type-III domain-containing protein 3A isoform X3 [Folsomia candida]|nr:fibronectin type-III domain-containing protein 3A isoform X3 [Folsomia candida]
MVRILHAEVCLGDVTAIELRPPLPRLSDQNSQQINHNNNNMDSSRDKDNGVVDHLGAVVVSKGKVNCCSNDNGISFNSPSSSPEPNSGNVSPILEPEITENGSHHQITPTPTPTTSEDDENSSETILENLPSSVGLSCSDLNHQQSEVKVVIPTIVIEELPALSDEEEIVETTEPKEEEVEESSESIINSSSQSTANTNIDVVDDDKEKDDVHADEKEEVNLCELCDNSLDGLEVAQDNTNAVISPVIVIIENVDDKDTSSTSSDCTESSETLKEDDSESALEECIFEEEKLQDESVACDEDGKIRDADHDQEFQQGDINIDNVEVEVTVSFEIGDGDASSGDSVITPPAPPPLPATGEENGKPDAGGKSSSATETTPVIVVVVEDDKTENEVVASETPPPATTNAQSSTSTTVTVPATSTSTSTPTSLLTGRTLVMSSSRPTPPSTLSMSHSNYRDRNHGRNNNNNNNNHQHHCPAHHHHLHHNPQLQTTFQFALSHVQAAAAASNLSNLLSQTQPHLQFQAGNFSNFRLPLNLQQQLNQNLNSHLLNPTPLGPPFSNSVSTSGLQMPPTNHSHLHNQSLLQNPLIKLGGKQQQQQQHKFPPPPQYQHHHHHQQQHQQHNQNQSQTSNLNLLQQGPAAVPMQFGYFAEQETTPWGNALCNGSPGLAGALPPLDILGSVCGGLGSPSSAPLPTAIIPLPLDPNFPPVVLPSYPTNTNTPNTQSTSGYSTAGHSRSSSPMSLMGPTNHGPGLLQLFDNGLLPLPTQPPCSSSSGGVVNPNFVLAAASTDLGSYPQFFPNAIGQFVVYFHINPSVSVSFTVGDQSQVVKGPMTVPLVSTSSSAPIPLPMQVPQGHVVQQIVDENGTLRHVIVSQQPPLIPMPNYAPNSQGQQFYPAGPSGYPNFTPMQQVPCPVPSPHQGPPGSNNGGGLATGYSIPAHAQKDERTQRQFMRIRRKLEQKQQAPVPSYNNGASYNNHPASIRKEPAYTTSNGTRKVTNGVSKSPANSGMEEDGSVGSTGSVTDSTGTQDEEEENRTLAMTEMLSSIIPPTVTEVTARSAYVQWSHPDRISESGDNKFPDFDVSDNDFRYEVFINEKSRDSRFRSIFVGSSLSCRVKDLKPGSVYAITYCSMLGDVKGNTCNATNFSTLAAEPDPPGCPRPVSRSRSSMMLKWNPPISDNGSKLSHYILEYDEGKGGSHFVEAYRGKNKQCTVAKLQPSYSYQFRLAAVNDIGKSRYTSVVSAMTAGSPPTQPAPPTISEAGVKYLRLEWKGRDTDDEYTLQMEDPSSGHGFMPVYNGSAPNYLCIGLKRNFQYKFRLRAQNEEGHSKWSDEVVLCTLPDRPCPPHKPQLKGRVNAYGFKVRWDPPSDTGGMPISAFALQIDQGNGYEEIYRGTEGECTVDRLSPGQSYALRVITIGPGGESDPSESCVITTEPVCPGKSHIPRVIGKPKSNSVHLKWSPPDWTGGSPINGFEVGCTTPDNQTQEAYRGKDCECIVNRLLPGRAYLFQIRAFNRIGAGDWSDPLEIISGAGSPDAPSAPKVVTKTSHIVLISWTEPLNNGSAVMEYRVQMASPTPTLPPTTPPTPEHCSSSTEEGKKTPVEEVKSETKDAPLQQLSSFTQVYVGPSLYCELKGLQPASIYLFRIQAINGAGSSDWSPVVTHEMPASSPNGVLGVEAVATCSSISLTWKIPLDNGSEITKYNVMMGETLLVSNSNSWVIDNLMPDTQHKIRIQAVNSVGPGPFSSTLKVWTKPLAPPPPKLECVCVAPNWMKLKWTEISSKNIEYLVQMINPYKDEFEVVYRGTASNAKVTRLNEDTEYLLRICALNGAGQGPFSDLYKFSTSKAPPSQVKGCKIELLNDSSTYRFEWFEVTCLDTIEYQFQVASKKRDMDFKTMYKGTERRVELNHNQLEKGVEYACRVCAIRVSGDGAALVGPYSNNVNFHIPSSSDEEDLVISSKSHSASSKSQARATNTFWMTMEEKMSKISYESRVGIVAVFALIILAFVISLITHHVVS